MKIKVGLCCLLLSFISVIHTNGCAETTTTQANQNTLPGVAKRVGQILKNKDWNALQKEAAPVIFMSEYTRLYASQWTKAQKETLFTHDELLQDIIENQPISLYSIATLEVKSGSKLRNYEKRKFDEFCDHVEYSLKENPKWVQIGEYIPCKETPSLRGPAMECKMVSNEAWRVEFQYYNQRWVVSRLIIISH